MKIVSKTQRKIRDIHRRRESALEKIKEHARAGDVDNLQVRAKSLADIEIELATAEQEPDLYDCAQCGIEFPDSEHIDLCVIAAIYFKANGEEPKRDDFGYGDAHRIKICGNCYGNWQIKVDTYMRMG